jgi:outer membrane receptor for ferrienterochelin and colicins
MTSVLQIFLPIFLAATIWSGLQPAYAQTHAQIQTQAQTAATPPAILIPGTVLNEDGEPLQSVTVSIPALKKGARTRRDGGFELALPASLLASPPDSVNIIFTYLGYKRQSVTIKFPQTAPVRVVMRPAATAKEQVVVTGTMTEKIITDSPVHVEVFTPTFFQKNPTPAIFDALTMVNGVQPQLNCSICNTGDIHINGMEGPYTMVTIDGMPIVSGLATVYGLSGIPNSMIERIEIVKGPASTLYGSEAVGGLINIVTKTPSRMPMLSVDVFGTTQRELNVDAALKLSLGEDDRTPAFAHTLLGVNYFTFQNRMDANADGFTDVTLQNRFSVFNKWEFEPTGGQNSGALSLAGRMVLEDRWGGQLDWTPQFRGSDSIYGETIQTTRFEVLGKYQLPREIVGGENVTFDASFSNHKQTSFYGTTPYNALQRIAFGQFVWRSEFAANTNEPSIHELLVGLAFRYTSYQDNTPATLEADGITPKPALTLLPGIFVQDEIALSDVTKLLLALRYDYNSAHGNVLTPRMSLKWSPNSDNVLRFNAGTGYRVVNLFTEDHAALTGAREVVIKNALRPEQSVNANLSFTHYATFLDDSPLASASLDATGFATYFSNQITADYDTDPTKIIYDNLNGFGVSAGVSADLALTFVGGLKATLGATYMEVEQTRDGVRQWQFFAPRFSGVASVSYQISPAFSVDYTSRFTSPMRLPATIDDLPPESPWFALHNIQATVKLEAFEFYGGVKNLFNYLPANPVIVRAFDPFDKLVADPATQQTFDPTRVYAAVQGIRGFLGVRWHL